jgi:hypothetical protein
MEKQNKALHFKLELTVNEDATWSYRAPKVNSHIEFSLPVQLFNATEVAKWIDGVVKEMNAGWDEAVKQYEAEQAEEAREKAAREQIEAEVKAEAKVDF